MFNYGGGIFMVHGNMYLFGDSVARGIVLDAEGTYAPIKDSFGALAAARFGVPLVNKARFGCTIAKGLDVVRRFISGGENTEVEGTAFLEFGGNDCDFLWNEVAAKPGEQHLPTTPLDAFSRMYGELIDALRSSGLNPIPMTLPPLVAVRYFDWITRNGLDRGSILSWLGDIQRIFRWHEEYDQTVRMVAAFKGCPLLDIRKVFLEKKDYSEFICMDGIHPNRKGHLLMESAFGEHVAGA